ncbi:MAG: TonB-dependent receptor [Breznakibacter sp.]
MRLKTFGMIYMAALLLCGLEAMAAGAEAEKGGMMRGVVLDGHSNDPIEYATIAVYSSAQKQLVTGAVTNVAGEFRIAGLSNGNFYVEVSFLGYESRKVENIEVTDNNRTLNLGQIKLSPASESLGEVEVVGDRKSFEYRIDKKVINVGKQTTAASMTAIEVLENVPSVKVDIEGNVSLRGSSGFTVLIDGKPTILEGSDALRQIPASSIDNIEIITNPSAKYQPDGTAGIINVITKKNKSQGINGQASANVGMYGTYGGDLLLNLRRKKINYSLGADFNKRVFPGESTSLRETYSDDLQDTTRLSAFGDGDRSMQMWGLRGGMEIDINQKNSATLGFRYGNRSMDNSSTYNYTQTSTADGSLSDYKSKEWGERGGDFYSVNASWLRLLEGKGHELRTQFDFGARTGEETSRNFLYDDQDEITSGHLNTEDGPSKRGELRIDYTRPFGETNKLEAGFQGRTEYESDETTMDVWENGQWENEPLYSKTTDGHQDIYALYSTYSGAWRRFGYQAGLRGEYSYRMIEYGDDEFTVDRFDYFPTLHLSFKLPADNQLMASYARRVERTRGWYLEPFITWQDAYNVRVGNPDILPEFIDSYEIGYLKQFEKAYFSMEAYYRVTHNKVEMIARKWEGDATGNVLMRQPFNIGKDYSLGLEGSFNLKYFKWWESTLMGNLYNYEITGEANGQDFSNSTFNWSARMNNSFYFSKNTQFQFNGSYNSPTATAQGRNESFYAFDAAFRADWMQRKLATVLQVRDVFATGKRENWARGADFYTFGSWNMKAPIVSLSVTYRFNNYSPKRQGIRNQQNMGADEMGGGEDF